MKLLTYTFFISMALLSESYRVSSAVSASKAEDTTLDGDAPSREGSSRIIILADSGLWRGPKMPTRSLPLLRHWDLEAAAAPGNVLAIERRDTNEDVASKVPIGRRDTMRCMVGRVYRPCWEV
uniref:Melanin-concentrating hormone n=1 Tax=Scleropages formosus TaxID=113540 RepID=A0A8C9R0Y9_SCLFO